ncbi:Rpn family recombination-promoting nuclease/putative transposase [Candidatus Erwinia dacicola]
MWIILKAGAGEEKSTTTPHDATFRQFLTQPDIARDFMEIHLPAELRAICDLSTLKLESGSFVEDDLRQYFSDVLYSLKTAAGDGYVHVLIEHESSPDRQRAIKCCPWSYRCCSIRVNAARIPTPPGGWMNLTTKSWQADSTVVLSRWLTLPSFLMTKSQTTAVWPP